jgi:hypothetical protein
LNSDRIVPPALASAGTLVVSGGINGLSGANLIGREMPPLGALPFLEACRFVCARPP